MEQRKFQRFADNSHVVFTSDTVKGEGRLENLSLGDAAILSDLAIARGEYLALKVTFPTQAATIEDRTGARPVDQTGELRSGIHPDRARVTAATQRLPRHLGRRHLGRRVDSPDALGKPPQRPASFPCQETLRCVIIHHTHRLHERIDDRAADEPKPSLFEILREQIALPGPDRNVGATLPLVDDRLPCHELPEIAVE